MWSVARTIPYREEIAVVNLDRQGFNTYLPKFLRKPGCPAPLFPGYVFVELSQEWRSVFSTRGVVELLMAGTRPAVVHEHEFNDLKAREDVGGYIELPEKIERCRFRKGQRVSVNSGPLIGLNGIVKNMIGSERVRVLFAMLGRSTPVMLRTDVLTVI